MVSETTNCMAAMAIRRSLYSTLPTQWRSRGVEQVGTRASGCSLSLEAY